jgi:hypothetical protein
MEKQSNAILNRDRLKDLWIYTKECIPQQQAILSISATNEN